MESRTSWMRNQDWSTLGIGNSRKWGVVLLESYFIILCYNTLVNV